MRIKIRPTRLVNIVLLISILSGTAFLVPGGQSAKAYQADLPTIQAQDMLERLTPEERVGQLFLVTFNGATFDENSQIYDLVANRHVGGIILLVENDNFIVETNTAEAIHQLVAQLQTLEWQSAQQVARDSQTGVLIQSHYIPLFVGIYEDGVGHPETSILSGLSSLPSQMAIGATWDSDLSLQIGKIVGQELSALGINLFFGPSLDVVESPEIALTNGLRADVFGGDPYWVGEMGREYVEGLNQGSQGRLIVAVKHFPGRGSTDRPPGEEPPTVRRLLEQLVQIELAPFFSVTGNAPDRNSMADGLLVSHIRYQGFQGNIRSTTRPVSFDPQALSQILALPQFSTWRQNGGLIISDDLGNATVRNFYAPGGEEFLGRLASRDAFLAGNDLLYLGNILSTGEQDTYSTVIKILLYFNQKYAEDPAFAQRVDNAVLRILAAKYRIYGGNFYITNILPPQYARINVGQSYALSFEVARQAATLISPDADDFDVVLPAPPRVTDDIVFLTDTRTTRLCSECPEQPIMAGDALMKAVLRLYGPQGGALVNPNRLSSFSFTDLPSILQGGAGNFSLENDLARAEWIIISMLDAMPNQTHTITLRQFLTERQDLLRNKRIIIFAFNAPYYLDSTDISKLTAYYALFSHTEPFVDVAARLLFQEVSATGSSPVSIPGTGYDLYRALTPDPEQVIDIFVQLPMNETATLPATPDATPTSSFRFGDVISIRTGVILDHNHHPVPGGTGVRFLFRWVGDDTEREILASTADGIARIDYTIDRTGRLDVRCVSDPAQSSSVVQLDISTTGLVMNVVPPTDELSILTEPIIITPISGNADQTPFSSGTPGFIGWLVLIAVTIIVGVIIFLVGRRTVSYLWGLRWSLVSIVGGLLAFNYLALSLPGSSLWLESYGIFGIIGVIVLGLLLGWIAGLIWWWAIILQWKQSD